eukprot:CAMPEP_0172672774 /NCGR_PEP_ID=MMETSP1074-20121228/11749_1 /TAXON_ID=2916 /ORGANISM="Ceratium fusus, Strain PA161109" /LENGTH=113 /DNA_ID=CAMNT_0013490003 /DNA_START=1176 /DNA_END=1514 /DNA_ORIENTATION=+
MHESFEAEQAHACIEMMEPSLLTASSPSLLKELLCWLLCQLLRRSALHRYTMWTSSSPVRQERAKQVQSNGCVWVRLLHALPMMSSKKAAVLPKLPDAHALTLERMRAPLEPP